MKKPVVALASTGKGLVEQSSPKKQSRAKSCFLFGSLFNNVIRSLNDATKLASADKREEAKKALTEAETGFNELRTQFPQTTVGATAMLGQIRKIQETKSVTLDGAVLKGAAEDLAKKAQAMMDEAKRFCR